MDVGTEPGTSVKLKLPTVTVDLEAHVLRRDGVEHVLTEHEADPLRYLAQRPGQPVSRAEILAAMRGDAPMVVTRAIHAT